MAHDFKKFPELTNSQLQLYYFQSPHKQITEDFVAKVVKVHDGDSITLRWKERDFDFPLRLANIQAPELKDELGSPLPVGKESQIWLENLVLNEEITIILTDSRVDKWGRLLGNVIFNGLDIGEQSVNMGKSVLWEDRDTSKIPSIEEVLKSG